MFRMVVTACVLILAGWSADGSELRLREEVTMKGGVVRLADVADIAGEDGTALGSVKLFPAPGPGRERLVRRGEIGELLSLSGVDTRRLVWSGAEQAVIRRPAGGK